jgi:hypothetical protein
MFLPAVTMKYRAHADTGRDETAGDIPVLRMRCRGASSHFGQMCR